MQVFYFGTSSMQPKTVPNKSIIQQVSLNVDDLCQFENCEDQVYTQYLELIRYTNTTKLSMLSINCSKNTVAMIDNYQEIWLWGAGIGIGAGKGIKFMNVPFSIGKFLGKSYTDVVVGPTHSLAIDSKHKLYIWGQSLFGSHGKPLDEYIYYPRKVEKLVFGPNSKKIYAQYVGASDNFSLIVNQNQIFSFGKEDKGRLGLDQGNIDYTDKAYIISMPTDIQLCGITIGLNHCLCWDASGAIYSWGSNECGKAGHPILKDSQTTVILAPLRIMALSEVNVVSASAGYNHSCALTYKGHLYQWGSALFSKYDAEINRPKQLDPQSGKMTKAIKQDIQFLKLSSFGHHNAAIDQNGLLYTWGKNVYFCLGHIDQKDYQNPTVVKELSKYKTVAAGCGENFTVVSCANSTNQFLNKNSQDFKDKIVHNIKASVSKSQLINFLSVQQLDYKRPQSTVLFSPNVNIKIGRHQLSTHDLRFTKRQYLDNFVRKNDRLVRDESKQKKLEIQIQSHPARLNQIQGIMPYRYQEQQHLQSSQSVQNLHTAQELQIVFDYATQIISQGKNTYFDVRYDLEDAQEQALQMQFVQSLEGDIKNKQARRNLILHGFKGVPVQSNFQEEIDLIFKEYQSQRVEQSSAQQSHKNIRENTKDQYLRQKSHHISKFAPKIQAKQDVKTDNLQIMLRLQATQNQKDQSIDTQDDDIQFVQPHQNEIDPQKILDKRKRELMMKGKVRDFKIAEAQRIKEQISILKQQKVYGNYVRKSLNSNFECYYKLVSERFKATDLLFVQLQERADAEDRYSRFLEKICTQIIPTGGDLDDLLSSVKIDLRQKSEYNKVYFCAYYSKQFTSQFKNEIELGQSQMKQINALYRPLLQDMLRLDKEVKANQEKYDRARERHLKTQKDYEEFAIILIAAIWNKESNSELRNKAQQRLQQQLQSKYEAEAQLKMSTTFYNNSLTQFLTQLQSSCKSLQGIFSQIFNLAKDAVMKTLVYEISRLRNLQYDNEQFFKEIEKYEDQKTEMITLTGQNLTLGMFAAKENFEKVSAFQNYSFMRNIADQISQSHRIILKKDTIVVDSDQDTSYDIFINDASFKLDLRAIINQHISTAHHKPLQSNTIEIDQFINSQNFYPKKEIEDILGFIDSVVQMSTQQDIQRLQGLEQLNQEQILSRVSKQLYQEVTTLILESFRTSSQFEISAESYDKFLMLIQYVLKSCQDLSIIKRVILMILTIYKLGGGQKEKIYLQQGLLTLPIWQKIDLWESLIYVSIQDEIDKSQTFTNREQLFKDKNVIFSNIFAISQNMINFQINKQDIKTLILKYGKIFQLYEIQIQELISFVENDGRIDLNKNVNSISVLSSLYHNQETQQKQTQSSVFVAKKVSLFSYLQVLLFEKKATQQVQPFREQTISQNEQAQNLNKQQIQEEKEASKQFEQLQEEQPEQSKKKAGFLKKLF